MYMAAKENKLDVFKLLLEKGADHQSRQKDGRPILGQAVRSGCDSGKTDMVKLLLEAKADIQGADDDNDTPLHLACMNSSFELATLLVENKADPNAKNNAGKKPLSVARGPGNWKALLQK